MQVDNNTVEKLKAVMQQNPELLKLLNPTSVSTPNKAGPKGGKRLVPGKQIEIIKEATDEPEPPTPISIAEAKRILKANSAPRVYSEEHKKVMLANLAKGREKRKAMLEQLKTEVQKKPPIIKKYVIKERAPKKVKVAASESEQDTDFPQTETEDTDYHVYKKLKRKERIMKKLNQLQDLAKSQKPVAVQNVPTKRYTMFY